MLSIYDAQAGAAAEVRPRRGRELRLQVSAPVAGGGIGLADLRRYLTADLVRRTAQRHRLAVSLDSDGESRALAALNIYPPEQATLPPSQWGTELALALTAGAVVLLGVAPALVNHWLGPAGRLFGQ